MINLNINKETLLYVGGLGLGAVLIFGAYLGGVTQGISTSQAEYEPQIADLKIELSEAQEAEVQAELELGKCKALRAGDALLACEEVCRDRVSKAVQVVKSLCKPR